MATVRSTLNRGTCLFTGTSARIRHYEIHVSTLNARLAKLGTEATNVTLHFRGRQV